MYNSKQFLRTVNWHFVNSCNMSCKYCFVSCCKELPLEESISVLEKLKGHFDRINFVGGEPTVSSKLIPFVKKAKEYGFIVSMVTNGFNLYHKPETFDEILTDFSIIGISIDSLNENTNVLIGRSVKNNVLSRDDYIDLCKKIKLAGCKLKINTVVSRVNLDENFNDFYETVMPDRIKLLQVLRPAGRLKQDYTDFLIEEDDYLEFVQRHHKFSEVICSENNELMLNSYYILNSDACFLDNKSGCISGSLLENDLKSVLKDIYVDENKYRARYA